LYYLCASLPLSTLKPLTSLIGGRGFFYVSCYNIFGDNMKLISKDKVSNTFSIPNWLKSIGYMHNLDYAKLTTYTSSPVFSLFRLIDDKYVTYAIVVIDGYRYVFEMTKGSRDVVSEFEQEISTLI